MKRRNIFLLTSLCILAAGGLAFAQDSDFQSSASEIIRTLTATPHIVRTRGFTPDIKQRCIVVKERHNRQEVQKTVMVSDNDTTPRVNLKIEFDVDSYAIRPGSYRLLDELGAALCSDSLSSKPVMIIGHTDSDGPDGYNLNLSLNRALAVKNYLLGNFHIPEDHLRTVGYGEAMPLVANTTPQNKQKNRRVEVRLDTQAW